MTGSSPKSPAIPAWQQPQQRESEPASSPEADTTETTIPNAEASTKVAEEPQPEILSEQAAKFLQDPSVREASWDKKAEFLRSKGVQQEQIHALQRAEEEVTDTIRKEDQLFNAWEKRSTHTQQKTLQQSPPAQPQVQQVQQPREVPPIVTYPEWLTKTERPPPLITPQRILNTAYVTAGLAATLYGLSTYIVAPMVENLTSARHDMHAHTTSKLEEFNERLTGIVSTVPSHSTSKAPTREEDTESIDSDPHELYHRDYGTQTSPDLEPSSTTSTSTEVTPKEKPDPTTTQTTRLSLLTTHLSELEESTTSNTTLQSDIQTRLNDLTNYLHDLAYSAPYFGSGGYYGASSNGTTALNVAKMEKEKSADAFESVRADIRGVKGVLLSARNFPVSAPRVAGR